MYGFAVLVYVFVGLLIIALVQPLIRRQVKRNLLYGLRTRKTLSDDAFWYPANEYAGLRFRQAGIVTILAAVVLDFIPGLTVTGYLLGCAVAMFGSLCWATVASMLYSRRL